MFRVRAQSICNVGDRASMVVLPHFGNWDLAASASLGLGPAPEHRDGAGGVPGDHGDGRAVA